MNILISHTSVAPFVQAAAMALYETDWLDRFITTLRYDPHSQRQRIAYALARAVRFDFERQMKRRSITDLPLAKVESHPTRELIRLLASKVDRGRRLTDLIWERTEPSFDKMVASKLTAQHDAVYGYEFSSLSTFQRAQELGITTIYDMPAPETQAVRQILDQEAQRFPVLQTPYTKHAAAREAPRTARRRAEWEYADIVIAASQFTRNSFGQAGLPMDKIRVVPYGAPPAIEPAQAESGGSPAHAKLQLLWAGSFNVRKGAHYLMQAWREHKLGRIADLQVFGAVLLPPELLEPVPPGIHFNPTVPRDELMLQYDKSDALIFPTLCDGFGMVVTEAWSRGLPVLTTTRAGASDLLVPEQNGILFEPADTHSLAEQVQWCHDHRDKLKAMRLPARSTAANWQWSDYRQALRSAVSSPLIAPSS